MWESVKSEIFINKINKYHAKQNYSEYSCPNTFRAKALQKRIQNANKRDSQIYKKNKLY